MDNERERHERAYYLWENSGRPEGRDMDHWNDAQDGEAERSARSQSPGGAEQVNEDPAEGSEEAIDRELGTQEKQPTRCGQTAAK